MTPNFLPVGYGHGYGCGYGNGYGARRGGGGGDGGGYGTLSQSRSVRRPLILPLTENPDA